MKDFLQKWKKWKKNDESRIDDSSTVPSDEEIEQIEKEGVEKYD